MCWPKDPDLGTWVLGSQDQRGQSLTLPASWRTREFLVGGLLVIFTPVFGISNIGLPCNVLTRYVPVSFLI